MVTKMNAVRILLGHALAIVVMCHAQADWFAEGDPVPLRIRLMTDTVGMQNPPGLSWRPYPGATGYQIEFREPSGATRQYATDSNWWASEAALPAGEYAWRARPAGQAADWSDWRAFRIDGNSVEYAVPTSEELMRRIMRKQRPRMLDFGPGGEAAWRATVSSARKPAVDKLMRQVREGMTFPSISDAVFPSIVAGQFDAENVRRMNASRRLAETIAKQARGAALLWRLTGNDAFLAEAKRRGDELASLAPRGATSYERQDQTFREIMWSLAYAYDLLEQVLSGEQKDKWGKAISERLNIHVADLRRDGWRMHRFPLDSHGVTNSRYLLSTAILALDVAPGAAAYLESELRRTLVLPIPWGGYDGGFANGTAYAEYGLVSLIPMYDLVKATTGMDPYASAWTRGFLNYLVAFLPPGQPTHQFGDGAEREPFWGVLKAYARRISLPLAAWYARNLPGEEDPLMEVAAPAPFAAGSVAPSPPAFNSAFFRSIGWVAMHSDLNDRNRTSLYFKSSPYGSFNHSHGDQNSFTLVSGGRPLLIDAGSYDWYGSSRWKTWYRQTKAHNAVTFDGGRGQIVDGLFESLRAGGEIRRFSASPDVDHVEADAAVAYGAGISKAARRVWFLRNEGAVVVWDRMVSAQERTFEWNMHAREKIQARGSSEVAVGSDGQSACISSLGKQAVVFQRRSAQTTDSVREDDHGYFANPTPVRDMTFVMLIDVGCKRPKVVMTGAGGAMQLQVGQTVISISQ